MIRRSKTMIAVAIALAAAGAATLGCGSPSHGGASASLAAPAIDDAGSLDDYARDPIGADVSALATALGLDQNSEERIRSEAERSWTDLRAEVERLRNENPETPLDEESMTALIEAKQRELDARIAAMLTPSQQAAFAELGGRLGP